MIIRRREKNGNSNSENSLGTIGSYNVNSVTDRMFVSLPDSNAKTPTLQCEGIQRWNLWSFLSVSTPHEDTAGRWQSPSQEEGSHQTLTLLAT